MKSLGDAGFDWTQALPEQAANEPPVDHGQCEGCGADADVPAIQEPGKRRVPAMCRACIYLKAGRLL